MKKNLIIVFGADRLGNYETFAPIINELQHNYNFEVLTIFQSKELLRKASRNSVLSNVYVNKHVSYISDEGLSLFHNTKIIFRFFFLVLIYKNVSLLTNREFRSKKLRIFFLCLKHLKVKTFFTKSFSRAPTKNLRSLLGGKYGINSPRYLCDFALIPTLEHRVEYGLVGYRMHHYIVTDYPKFYPSWAQLIKKVSRDHNKVMKSDVLFVFSKFYDGLEKVIQDVLNVILSIDGINIIVLKPHPTIPLPLIENLVNDINISSKKLVLLSEENVALLSFNTEVVISYATSASYDAKVAGKFLINYYDANKSFIDEYRDSEFSDVPNFELIESSILSDFLSNCICYEEKQLKESLLGYFSNKNKRIDFKKEMVSDPSSLVRNFL